MMSIDQIIEVLTAFRDKKPLRIRDGNGWRPYSIPFNHYIPDMFRDIANGETIEVAPEPVKCWAIVGSLDGEFRSEMYGSKEEAARDLPDFVKYIPNARIVELEEVVR